MRLWPAGAGHGRWTRRNRSKTPGSTSSRSARSMQKTRRPRRRTEHALRSVPVSGQRPARLPSHGESSCSDAAQGLLHCLRTATQGMAERPHLDRIVCSAYCGFHRYIAEMPPGLRSDMAFPMRCLAFCRTYPTDSDRRLPLAVRPSDAPGARGGTSTSRQSPTRGGVDWTPTQTP